jgi:plasmid stabilization system protein ParE
MARISYASRALADLERISDFLSDQGPEAQLEALDLIDEAITILARHPLIGHQAEHDMRELLISLGKTGHVALYSYEIDSDAVSILAVRHQREAGFHS